MAEATSVLSTTPSAATDTVRGAALPCTIVLVPSLLNTRTEATSKYAVS